MNQIGEAEIVRELCPTSNLLTKALPDREAERDTLRAFAAHGVPFTIASDAGDSRWPRQGAPTRGSIDFSIET